MRLMKVALASLLMLALLVTLALAVTANVDKKEYVCMMQDMVLGKAGIPIQFAGKTYYGCCEMCKEKLRKDAKSRFALDPVSKKRVDKASALIGADPNGKVYYFESAENLKKFRAGS